MTSTTEQKPRTATARIQQTDQGPTLEKAIKSLKRRIGSFVLFYDPWDHKNALVKLAGECVTCSSLVYQVGPTWSEFGDPDPDPRGALGEKHACASLVANEYGMHGKDVYQCFDCANTRGTYQQGLDHAQALWISEIKSITVIGRKWFDKVNGNTYFTSKILVNGVTVGELPMEYGYGDQYLHASFDWLDNNGYIQFKTRVQTPKGCSPVIVKDESYWQLCERMGIHCEYSATDVTRKRDL